MCILNWLSKTTTFAEVETVWKTYFEDVAKVQPAIGGWGARWVFADVPAVSFSIAGGKQSGWRDIPGCSPEFVSPHPFQAVHHPHLPASLFVSSESQTGNEILRLQELDEMFGLTHALSFSHLVLRNYVSTATSSAVFHSALPVMLVDERCRIHRMSRSAAELLERVDFPIFTNDHRALIFRSELVEKQLRDALHDIFLGHDSVSLRNNEVMLTISAAKACVQPRLAIVVIKPLSGTLGANERELRAAFNLTAAQARLAIALIGGESLEDYALRSGLTLRGVRWHLKLLMQRFDCERREQLISKLVQWAS